MNIASYLWKDSAYRPNLVLKTHQRLNQQFLRVINPISEAVHYVYQKRGFRYRPMEDVPRSKDNLKEYGKIQSYSFQGTRFKQYCL